MNNYELLCILSGKIPETEVASFEKTIEDALKNNASTVHFTHHLDRKKLAYPIDGHTYGYYFLAEFEAEKDAVATLKRELSLMNSVLRHSLAIKKSIGKPPVTERKQAFDALPAVEDLSADMPQELQAAPTAQLQEDDRTTTQLPSVPTPIQSGSADSPETVKEAPAQSIGESVTPQEEHATEQSTAPSIKDKKKQTKLSYEELDKKLDEIINNDIF